MSLVVINSIGTASPNVSKILSDAFKVPQEYILKLLYNAPSVLFQEVDTPLAKKAESTLSELGLDVRVVDHYDAIEFKKEKYDISIDLEDPLKLPSLIKQIALFHGCKESEALNLLIAEPGIILGGVSKATAMALQNRIDGKVCYSEPQKDLYSLTVQSDQKTASQIKSVLGIHTNKNEQSFTISDLSFEASQKIWKQFGSKKSVKIINQSHQKVNLELVSFDLNEQIHINFLNQKIGIPKEILPQIFEALPIVLFEKISARNAKLFAESCRQTGLDTKISKIEKQTFRIKISSIPDLGIVKKILEPFVDKDQLPAGNSWKSAHEIPALIADYLLAQLKSVHCQAELI